MPPRLGCRLKQKWQPGGLVFQLMDAWAGTDGTAGSTLGKLVTADIVVESDGSFTVTLDAQPANGRVNHIQLLPGSHSLLIRAESLIRGYFNTMGL